jgi:hypothetical protein
LEHELKRERKDIATRYSCAVSVGRNKYAYQIFEVSIWCGYSAADDIYRFRTFVSSQNPTRTECKHPIFTVTIVTQKTGEARVRKGARIEKSPLHTMSNGNRF